MPEAVETDQRLGQYGSHRFWELGKVAINQVKECAGGDLEAIEMPVFTRRGWKNLDYSQELYFPTWRIPCFPHWYEAPKRPSARRASRS